MCKGLKQRKKIPFMDCMSCAVTNKQIKDLVDIHGCSEPTEEVVVSDCTPSYIFLPFLDVVPAAVNILLNVSVDGGEVIKIMGPMESGLNNFINGNLFSHINDEINNVDANFVAAFYMSSSLPDYNGDPFISGFDAAGNSAVDGLPFVYGSDAELITEGHTVTIYPSSEFSSDYDAYAFFSDGTEPVVLQSCSVYYYNLVIAEPS